MKKLILALITALTVTANSQAVTFLWNNTGSQWTSGTSWTNGVQPTATSSSTTTDDVQFGNVGANFNTVDLTSSRSAKTVTFLANANAYTFTTASAKVLTTSAGVTNNSTAIQTFNLLVENANASNTWYQAAGGAMVFNNAVTLTTASSSTSRTLTLAGDGAFTFNNEFKQGGLSTAGKSIYTGNGTVTFNGTNTLGGGFDITGGGTVVVNGGTGVGQALITLGGASGTTNTPRLTINTVNGLSNLNSLKGSTSLSTMGTLDLLGADTNTTTTYVMNQYQGNNMNFTNHGGYKTLLQFTNSANTLTVSSGSSGGRRLFNNSTNLTIQFDGTLDIGGTVADISVVGGVGDFLFKGSLLNTGSALRGLTKSGTGTATFQAVNSYNGDTTVQDGTFIVDTAGSITSSSAVVTGGTLRVKGAAGTATVNGGSLLVNSGGIVGNTTVGGGTLLVDGVAGNVVMNSGIATVNGVMSSGTINGSLLSVNGTAGNILVNTGGTLGGSGTVGVVILNGGTVSPGNSPGLLTTSSLDASNGNFLFQLGAPTSRGVTYDAIDVSNLLTLGANTSWTFQTDAGYTYKLNDTYDLFNWGTVDTTSFNPDVLLGALPDLNTPATDLKWDVNSFTIDGVISVIPEPTALELLTMPWQSLKALCRMQAEFAEQNPVIATMQTGI